MRKLKLQVQMSVDGFIAGPNGEMDWMEWNWDDELKNYITKITSTVNTILLGRKLAEGFIRLYGLSLKVRALNGLPVSGMNMPKPDYSRFKRD